MKPIVKKLLMPGFILVLMLAALPLLAAPIGEYPVVEVEFDNPPQTFIQ